MGRSRCMCEEWCKARRDLRSVVSSELTKHRTPTTGTTLTVPPEEQRSVVRQVRGCRDTLNVMSHLWPLSFSVSPVRPHRRFHLPFRAAAERSSCHSRHIASRRTPLVVCLSPSYCSALMQVTHRGTYDARKCRFWALWAKTAGFLITGWHIVTKPGGCFVGPPT